MDLNKNSIYIKNNRTGNLLDKKWFLTYSRFREFQPAAVKIYKIKKERIYMENVSRTHPYLLPDIIDTCDDIILKNILKNYFDIMSSIFIFGYENKFFHNDLNLLNFMSDEYGNLVLLDPESFVFTDPVNVFEVRYKMLSGFMNLQQRFFSR